MWIIPNTLTQLNGSLDTEEITSDSKEFFQIYASSLLVRSKAIRWQTCCQRWKRGGWTALLFGRIVKPSQQNHSKVECWISSLLPIHANHSQQQENERGQMIQGTCGHTSGSLSEKHSRKSVSLKTSRATSLSDSEKSLPIWLSSDIGWKTIVASQRGEYSRRLRSAHRTNGNGCLSWPTATARDHMGPRRKLKNGENVSGKGVRFGMDLNQSVQKWATPETQNSTGYQNQKNGTKTARLGSQVLDGPPAQESPNTNGRNRESWATPQSRDHRSGHPDRWENVKERSRNLNDQQMVVNGKLNADWVESLMGLPVGWTQIAQTASDSSETESYPKQQKKHSEPCGVAS